MQAKKESGLVKGRVSVITPVYNGERYLPRLLDSILAQSWDNLEMILADDGSTDQTLKAAESYREKFEARGFPYRVIAAAHQNASAAINHCLPWVTGEFLIWPDSDDYLESGSIRKRAEFLQANPHYACVRSLSRYIDEQGRPAARSEPLGDLQNERLIFPVLESKTFVCCGCYMLRTGEFFNIYPQRRIPECEEGQNFQMLLPVLYTHPCPTLRKELYVVCVHPDSHSRRARSFQEAEKRCAAFEALIDEITALCGIQNRGELRRLSLWKKRRRYFLYRQYAKWNKAAAVLLPLAFCGGLTRWDLLCFFQGTWLYQQYKRLRR